MKRSSLNFVIDAVSFLVMLGLGFTAVIMKYILPPGSGGLGRLSHSGAGRQGIKHLWSMGRHDWGGVHFYLAVSLLVLMAVHIYLHWGWIKKQFKSLAHR